jgi:hypothetical protein
MIGRPRSADEVVDGFGEGAAAGVPNEGGGGGARDGGGGIEELDIGDGDVD